MRVIEQARRPERSRLDHAALVGAWRNTDPGASGIRQLYVTDAGGTLRLRLLGAGRPRPYDWGDVEARGYAPAPNSQTGWAFTACHDIGYRTMRISAYTRAGLLVLTTYNAFAGAGWPQPYWGREFFHREPGPPPVARPRPGLPGLARRDGRGGPDDQADHATAPLLPWQLDPAPLVATWRNVDPAATRLSRVRIDERRGYLVIRPHGVWTPRRHDWHTTVGSAYAEDVRTCSAVAFSAFFRLAAGEVEMVGYLNRRVLTTETATTFGDGRAPYFVREHFYPTDSYPTDSYPTDGNTTEGQP